MINEGYMVYDIMWRMRYVGNIISKEIAIGKRYADLAYLEEGMIISIECKLKNWQQALEQAKGHANYGADYAYIYMPHRERWNHIIRELEKFGIGIFEYLETPIRWVKCGGCSYPAIGDTTFPLIEILKAKKQEDKFYNPEYFRKHIIGAIEYGHGRDLFHAKMFHRLHEDIPDWIKLKNSKEKME